MAIVLLDVMGTLVSEPFYEAIPRALGMTLEQVIAEKHPTAWLEFERGEIDEPTFLRRFFADGRDFDHAALKAALWQSYAWLDGMEALCGELSARHGCHLLSNYPVWYRIIEEKLELSRYADWSFVSCNLGVRKPHPGIYQAAIDQLGDPGAMIFVDDRQQNCDAAMALGIDALRFRDAATLRGELVARGLLD